MLKEGDAVDRFVIEAVLGEGGMGRVYRALDPKLGRRVALKLLLGRDGVSPSPEAVRRMEREARAVAAFSHPNVVSIFDVGEFEGTPYLAMELVTGETLRRFVGDPDISYPQKLAWALDVARGLAAAHRAGLVHRDVKPDNVMITVDGVVKILDFGIARGSDVQPDGTAPTAGELATVTAADVALGTPQYMAPEQIRGEPLDGRADQFAWGATTYELLSGRVPWKPESSSRYSLLAAVLTTYARPLREVAPEVELRVSDAIARSLEKKRDARFESMGALLEAIEGRRAMPLIQPSAREIAGASTIPPPGAPEAPTPALPGPPRQPRQTKRAAVITGVDPPLPKEGEPAGARAGSPTGGARRAAVVAAVAVLAGAAALVALRRGQPETAAPPKPPAASNGTGFDDRPTSPATAEAVRAFRDGMRARRDADSATSRERLEEATQLDPTFASAHLERAIAGAGKRPGESSPWIDAASHEHFTRALRLRDQLPPRDRAVLEALEPLMSQDPPDADAALTRLREASARFPRDAALLDVIALLATPRSTFDDALAACDAELAVDPGAAVALLRRGKVRESAGDGPGARADFEACLRAQPLASECRARLLSGVLNVGECETFARGAREYVALHPADPVAYGYRALSLAMQHEARPAIDELIRREVELLPPESREDRRLYRGAWISDVFGQFDQAIAFLGAAEKVRFDANDADGVEDVVKARMTEMREAGEEREAVDEGARYLQRAAALPQSTGRDLLWILSVERRAGRISGAEYAAKRAEWVKRKQVTARGDSLGRRELWALAYALPAETEEEAREAYAAMPDGGLRVSLSDEYVNEATGRVLVLAGRPHEAISYLEPDATCVVDFFGVRANYWLGRAREAMGDKAAACAAYAKVHAYWGDAAPRSVTVEAARMRSGPLRCP